MPKPHFTATVDIKEITFPSREEYINGRTVEMQGERTIEDVTRITLRADTLEGVVVATQQHMDVILGISREDDAE